MDEGRKRALLIAASMRCEPSGEKNPNLISENLGNIDVAFRVYFDAIERRVPGGLEHLCFPCRSILRDRNLQPHRIAVSDRYDVLLLLVEHEVVDAEQTNAKSRQQPRERNVQQAVCR
jgi:hypothetical protein